MRLLTRGAIQPHLQKFLVYFQYKSLQNGLKCVLSGNPFLTLTGCELVGSSTNLHCTKFPLIYKHNFFSLRNAPSLPLNSKLLALCWKQASS